MPFDKRTLKKEIDRVLCKDRHFLRRRLGHLPPADDPQFARLYNRIRDRLQQSQQIAAQRKASLPVIHYPNELPITAEKDRICAAIQKHQVVVVTGETGSGKTTQIPKICLEAGRGIYGKIAITQPRRIAATSLSSQVAKELDTNLGEKVGFRIRFNDKTRDETLIQFVTDGLLLAEIQGDRFLTEYDTIVIDEAHERTLNIDFLLGYLKQLLLKRPELKLIITSATIDIDKFSAAFPQRFDLASESYLFTANALTADSTHQEKINAPIISVSGRLYPVEVRYFPIDELMEEQGDQTMVDLVQEAVEDLLTESSDGDILVFMSGIQEIRETIDRLGYLEQEGFMVLPLYGRLTHQEQNRIFKGSRQRKIILSTNIAETSITVLGIHYVVDTGRARISQYNSRTGTQGLPIKAISQSSADQRKGRCGRVSDGICIRLYSEEDYLNRDQYTTPEIQRSNLSEVILRLLDLRLGDIDTFPFIDPPESAQIRAGFRTLQELGALNDKKRLTPIGKEMASLPVDPRTARMILQANREKVLYPVLIIASAISCQDPREKPEDKKTQAEQKHARFKSRESDLISLLNLWEAYHTKLGDLKSQGKMRKFCKANFLSYNRIREWQDIQSQLERIVREKKWYCEKPDGFDYDGIHRSILAGYLTHIAKLKEKKSYQGTQNREFLLFPGSDQYQSRHPWIVAIELIETAKLYAHTVARINPDWLEALAGNLCKKSWNEPFWDEKLQRVVAIEKVTLFGFCLVDDRKVFYGRINREEATRIFVRQALVEGRFSSELPFWKHNRKLIKQIEAEEAKIRTRSLLVSDEVIEDFYLKRISKVACLDDLKKLIKKNGGDRFLFMQKEDLLREEVSDNSFLFPNQIRVGNHQCKLEYLFEPGNIKDGVTIHLPPQLLGSVEDEDFEYLVPGLLREKINWILKNLPKELRKKLVPIPEKAENIWEEMVSLRYSTASEAGESLPPQQSDEFYQELSEVIFRTTRVHIMAEKLKQPDLPDYLRMNFAIRKGPGGKLHYCRTLKPLLSREPPKDSTWQKMVKKHERWGIKNWDFGKLLEKIDLAGEGEIAIWGYRTLVLEGNELLLTVVKNEKESRESCLRAVPRLVELQLGDELAWIFSELRFPPESLYRLQYLWKSNKELSNEELQRRYDAQKKPAQQKYHEQIQQRTFDMVYQGICGYNGEAILDKKGFDRHLQQIGQMLPGLGRNVVMWINEALEIFHQILINLEQHKLQIDPQFRKRFFSELSFFFSSDCLEKIPFEQWKHCTRILKCYKKRIVRHLEDPQWEEARHTSIKPYQERAEKWGGPKTRNIENSWDYQRYCWMLEELKVSEFAQELSTAFPISVKRIEKFLQQI